MTASRSTRAAVCERCGRSFGCDAAGGGCWCGAHDLPAPTRDGLAAAYGDCLCPVCLAELAAAARALT